MTPQETILRTRSEVKQTHPEFLVPSNEQSGHFSGFIRTEDTSEQNKIIDTKLISTQSTQHSMKTTNFLQERKSCQKGKKYEKQFSIGE